MKSTSCESRDQEILLLVHDELSGWRKALIRWHIRGCAACRQREATLREVSGALSVALGGRAFVAARKGVAPIRNKRSAAVRLVVVACALLAIGVSGAAIYNMFRDDCAGLPLHKSTGPQTQTRSWIKAHQPKAHQPL